MARDYLHIGSSPSGESCAQVGAANYYELSKLELAAFKKAIIAVHGEPPEGASLGIKDREVVVVYDTNDEKATKWAFSVESDTPEFWADAGMTAPRLDDPEFTKTDLIAPVEGGKYWMGDEPKCDIAGTVQASSQCAPITNEFFDANTKLGPWANLCPACFSVWGRGVGTGLGQRYKKATDGKFYKVEG